MDHTTIELRLPRDLAVALARLDPRWEPHHSVEDFRRAAAAMARVVIEQHLYELGVTGAASVQTATERTARRRLTHVFSGTGFPVGPAGEVDWQRPESIAGTFKIAHQTITNRDDTPGPVIVLDNGENPSKRWAVDGPDVYAITPIDSSSGQEP